MSKFHVGQMVVVVAASRPETECYVGRVGTILRRSAYVHGNWVLDVEPRPGFLCMSVHESRMLPINTGNPDTVETEEEVSA